ncbi:peptidylprolyl isomerase [Vogesella sp. LIG4]|uniref:peptidylprolyl isomerase n=1 Tax=Vogesella sp. LIG4 TaxID=1192162 RepID=UPI00081FFDBD|nr:peptidylprolyl isomerase [Vogesella sp. LIG4]SCK25142.1 peptidyl-prolyl cis-trans isomerase C [Vogesella sp. LIG4]
MNKRFKQTLIALTLAAAAGSAMATPSVNGVSISQQRIDAVVKMMEAQGQPSSPQMVQMVTDQLVTAEVLRQEAVKKGMDKSSDFQAEMENAQAMSLANRYIKDYVHANPVTEAQIKAEYDKAKAEFPEKKSYHARHILVKTEAEAKAVLEALKKGKPFNQLAKEKSIDPGSKNTGGDLGWQDPATFVPEFSGAMVKLAKGQVTAVPVKTQFGYHIIKLDDVKVEAAPPLEQLRPQLEQRVQGQRIEALIKDLKAKAKVQ